MSENPTLLHLWFERVWNQKDESAIDEMLAETCKHHGLSIEPVVGAENFKVFFRDFVNAFPDMHVTIHDVIREGDKLAARYTVRGVHQGDGLGLARTGREIEFTGAGMCRIEGDKFVEVWNEVNFLAMYQQLGAIDLQAK